MTELRGYLCNRMPSLILSLYSCLFFLLDPLPAEGCWHPAVQAGPSQAGLLRGRETPQTLPPIPCHYPLIPTVGNPSSHLFQCEFLSHPKEQTVIGWESAAALSRVLWIGLEAGRCRGALGAGVGNCRERPSLPKKPIYTAVESEGLFPSLTQAEPPGLCAALTLSRVEPVGVSLASSGSRCPQHP